MRARNPKRGITRSKLVGMALAVGLLAALGAWADFEEIDELVADIYQQRLEARDRSVWLDS